jgi:putative sporulation protein YtxC
MVYHISISTHEPTKVIRLRACLGSVITQLQQVDPQFTMTEIELGDRFLFSCQMIQSSKKNQCSDKEVRKKLGEVLAEYICDCQEPEIIRHMIQQEFKYCFYQEMIEIEKVVYRFLEGSAWEYAQVVYLNRRQKLAKQLAAFLKENKDLAIDGFTHFRLHSYKEALFKCVKDAIKEYLVDQEYKEFISLLRSFLVVQKSKIPLVHLLHVGKSKFRVLKGDGTPLNEDEMDGIFQEMIEQSFSHEDFIVSILLSIAPERVILHTNQPEENLLRTLIQIFHGRIVICYGCHHCGIPLHGDA